MNDLLQTRILIYSKDGINLKPIKIYKDENGKNWVEAKNNTKFVIEVKNNLYRNILAVVSVDGLSVISGKQASLEHKNGYVISPYSNLKIKGWRTSLENVREFVFTSNKKQSYSHKLGADESNIGVIGVAVFGEKYESTFYPSYWPSITTLTNTFDNSKYNSAPYITITNCTSQNTTEVKDAIALTSFTMATKQGQSIEDNAVKVHKEFEEQPLYIETIYYDSRENLIAKGIIREEQGMPKPFIESEFCPSL